MPFTVLYFTPVIEVKLPLRRRLAEIKRKLQWAEILALVSNGPLLTLTPSLLCDLVDLR